MVITGDMNKHIGNDELGVAGGHEKVTFGDELVRELLATDEYVLVNNTSAAKGGPYTRSKL